MQTFINQYFFYLNIGISDSLENPSPCIENEDSDSGKDVLSIYDGDMREDLQELL